MVNLKFIGLFFSVALFIFLLFRKFNKKWKKGLAILASFLFILFMGFSYAIPLNPALNPSGNKEVLTSTVFYKHKSEYPEMLTDDKEREIPVGIWYPKDAKKGSLPILLFSHGSFGVKDSNESLFLELASRGYIVMSLDHPHHSFMTTLSDNRKIMVDFNFLQSVMKSQGSQDLKGTLESLKGWLEIRLEDINYVLDKILDEEKDNDYEEYVDKSSVFLSGHSLGGSAALAVGRQRSHEIKALVILESPFAEDIIGIEGDKYIFTKEEYPLPILHIYSDSLYDKLGDITTYDMNYKLLKSKDSKFVNKHIKGVGHIGLTDMNLVSPIITNLIDGNLDKREASETLLEINSYVLEFLKEYK